MYGNQRSQGKLGKRGKQTQWLLGLISVCISCVALANTVENYNKTIVFEIFETAAQYQTQNGTVYNEISLTHAAKYATENDCWKVVRNMESAGELWLRRNYLNAGNTEVNCRAVIADLSVETTPVAAGRSGPPSPPRLCKDGFATMAPVCPEDRIVR